MDAPSNKMGDELMFPANDAFSLINDLRPADMMNEEVLANDINPSFPQPEVINIPEIIPPGIISPKDPTKSFVQSPNQSYSPMAQLRNPSNAMTSPLQQQQQPLVSNSNMAEQMKYGGHMPSNSPQRPDTMHMKNPMVNNNINFASPSGHMSPMQNANSQCLVIRGQRIPITQSAHNSSVINIKPAQNANTPLVQTCSAHSMHSSSVINASNNLIQTMMVKGPQQPSPTGQNTNKPPMKGQIIKTPDQRLMFVTEVNGKRVGYLIQQPKQPNVEQPIPSPTHTPSQTPPPQNVLNQHFENRSNQVNLNINIDNDTTDTMDLNNHNNKTAPPPSVEPISFTLDENKEIIMTQSATKELSQPLLKTDMKSLREKLLNLRNPLNMRNQTSIKSPPQAFPSVNKTVEEKLDSSNRSDTLITKAEAEVVDTEVNTEVNTEEVHRVAHTGITTEPTVTTNSPSPSNSRQSPCENSPLSHEDKPEIYNEAEEDDAQELEFSENDLIADFDDNQSCSPDYEMGEDDVQQEENADGASLRRRGMSTDDEDLVPLSMLKSDNNDDSLSPNEEKAEHSDEDVLPKKVKSKIEKLKGDPGDPVNEKSKKKSKTKPKKKKDPRKPPRPIIAYQLFFREVQHEIREQNPELTFGEISKEVSKKWDSLDDDQKKKYRLSHETAKAEFAVKMKAYNEMIAVEREERERLGESVSPEDPASPEFQSSGDPTAEERLVPPDEADVENELTEEIPKKKTKKASKAAKGRKNKKPAEKKKAVEGDHEEGPLTVKVVGLTENKHKAHTPGKTNGKQQDFDDNPPSSPSLPSSPSSSDEEDSESAITRIREKAAELHKYLKQQRFVVAKKKKSSRKSKSANKSVETVSPPSDEENADEELNETPPAHTETAQTKTMDPRRGAENLEKEVSVKKEDIFNESEVEDTEGAAMDVDEPEDKEKNEMDVDMEDKDEVKDQDGVGTTENDVEAEEIDEEDVEKENEMEEDEEKNGDDSEDEVKQERTKQKKRTFRAADKEGDASSDDDENLEKCFQNLRRKKSPRLRKIEEAANREKERKSKLKKEKSPEKSSPRKRKSLRNLKSEETGQSGSEEENTPEKSEENHADDKKEESDEDSSTEKSDRLKPDTDQEKGCETPTVESIEYANEGDANEEDANEETKESEAGQSEPAKPAGFRIPKKSQAGTTNENGMLALRGPRICIRQSCENPCVTSRERGGQYCGNDCLVLYCREVFNCWVIDRQLEEKNKT